MHPHYSSSHMALHVAQQADILTKALYVAKFNLFWPKFHLVLILTLRGNDRGSVTEIVK